MKTLKEWFGPSTPTDADLLQAGQPIFALDYLPEHGASVRVTALRAVELDEYVSRLADSNVYTMRVFFVLTAEQIYALEWSGSHWSTVEDVSSFFDDGKYRQTSDDRLHADDTEAMLKEYTRLLLMRKEPKQEIADTTRLAAKAALGKYKFHRFGERLIWLFRDVPGRWLSPSRNVHDRPPFLQSSEQLSLFTGEVSGRYLSIHPHLREQAQALSRAVVEGLEDGSPMRFNSIREWSKSPVVLPLHYLPKPPSHTVATVKLKMADGTEQSHQIKMPLGATEEDLHAAVSAVFGPSEIAE